MTTTFNFQSVRDRMATVMIERSYGGVEGVTEEDLARAGFSAGEIARHAAPARQKARRMIERKLRAARTVSTRHAAHRVPA